MSVQRLIYDFSLCFTKLPANRAGKRLFPAMRQAYLTLGVNFGFNCIIQYVIRYYSYTQEHDSTP